MSNALVTVYSASFAGRWTSLLFAAARATADADLYVPPLLCTTSKCNEPSNAASCSGALARFCAPLRRAAALAAVLLVIAAAFS
jgi:hypothetical protein